MSQIQHLTFTKRLFFILTFLSIWISNATAEVALPKIFSNNMIIQQGIHIPIWGWAEPEEKITVKLADQAKTTKADSNGKWILNFDKCDAGGPYEMTVIGTNKIEITGVLIGEVWLCSGQSNMAMTLRGANNSQKEIAEANDPMIRMFTVQRYADGVKPASNCSGQWLPTNPQTAGSFSATAFFLANICVKNLKCLSA